MTSFNRTVSLHLLSWTELLVPATVAMTIFVAACSPGIREGESTTIEDATPPPQEASPFELCDLDKDWDCDEADEQLFADALGKCRGEPGYSFDADVDGDGCVGTTDQRTLFPETR